MAAAQGAGNDGELAVRRPANQIFFGHVGHGANHDVTAIVADQLGGHAFELAAEKHVQEKGLNDVVTVVTQRDFGDLQLVGHAVQNAPAQAAAQAAHGFAFRNHLLHDAVGVLRFDVKRHAHLLQVLRQDVVRKTGLLLVQVDRDQLKFDRRALLHLEQDVEHGVAVFAARDANHHAVAFFDHVVVHDGLAHLAAQPFFQLVGFALNLDASGGVWGEGGDVIVNPGSSHLVLSGHH